MIIAFIEAAHAADGAFSNHQARPYARFHLDGVVTSPVFAGIPVGEEGFEKRHAEQERQDGGKPDDWVLFAAVGIQELPAGHDRLGVLFHEGKEIPDGPLGENHIRVEQQRIAARHDPEGPVVGGRKTPILVILDPPDLRKLYLQHGHAAVPRGVVDDDDLEGQTPDRSVDGA